MSMLRVEADVPPSDCERAAQAALAYLRSVEVTPVQAATGRWAREGWEVSGYREEREPSADEMRWAEAFDGAEDAAEKELRRSHATGSLNLNLVVPQEAFDKAKPTGG